MKEYFASLKPRERMFLVTGAIFLVLAFLYWIIWEPFSKSVDSMKLTVVQQQSTLSEMKKMATELTELRKKSLPSQKNTQGQSLLTLIDSSAKNRKLGPALKRVEPVGDSKVRVRLDKADFNDMVRWLGYLEQNYGILATSITIDTQSLSGRVNARLVMEGL
ncbi:MAG TPA: type II secretion system protein M [Gammaproteobacteria bacterium]|nr:type II secretion system protein M [Gammaproteobacteria bacterium]